MRAELGGWWRGPNAVARTWLAGAQARWAGGGCTGWGCACVPGGACVSEGAGRGRTHVAGRGAGVSGSGWWRWERRRGGQRGRASSAGLVGMRRIRWQVAAVATLGLALVLEALPSVLHWLRVGRRQQRRRPPRREVLFFPSQVTCTEALLQAPGEGLSGPPAGCPCSLPHGESSLSRLLSALLAARVSLELCLFAFSSPQLGRAVQLLHKRGVRIRVITDCDYMALNGSQIGLLRKAGRPGVRAWSSGPSSPLMPLTWRGI